MHPIALLFDNKLVKVLCRLNVPIEHSNQNEQNEGDHEENDENCKTKTESDGHKASFWNIRNHCGLVRIYVGIRTTNHLYYNMVLYKKSSSRKYQQKALFQAVSHP